MKRCPFCGKIIHDEVTECHFCHYKFNLHKKLEPRVPIIEDSKIKEKAKSNKGCFVSLIFVSLLISLCSLFTSNNDSSCYNYGYKSGRCAMMSFKGMKCDEGDNIVIPQSCRGKKETDKGHIDGSMSVR